MDTPSPGSTKDQLRQRVLAQRAELTSQQRLLHDENLLHRSVLPWLEMTLAPVVARGETPIVAAYVPAGTEPGAALGRRFIDELVGLSGGARLLLPLCPDGPPAPLNWGIFAGTFTAGKYGLLEPDTTATGGALPPAVLGDAHAIVLPGVAADPKTGMRMGRGAGYYDRSLALVQPRVPTAVALHPHEVVEGVPYDEHDYAVDAILTASGIVRCEHLRRG